MATAKADEGKPVLILQKSPFEGHISFEKLSKDPNVKVAKRAANPVTVSSPPPASNPGAEAGADPSSSPPSADQFDAHPGEYANKMIFLKEDIPAFIRAFLPEDSTILREESWSKFPHYHCNYVNEYFGENFGCVVQTALVNDHGENDNVRQLVDHRHAQIPIFCSPFPVSV